MLCTISVYLRTCVFRLGRAGRARVDPLPFYQLVASCLSMFSVSVSVSLPFAALLVYSAETSVPYSRDKDKDKGSDDKQTDSESWDSIQP
jgi:hypothetical protein